jgi:hypothetical protein
MRALAITQLGDLRIQRKNFEGAFCLFTKALFVLREALQEFSQNNSKAVDWMVELYQEISQKIHSTKEKFVVNGGIVEISAEIFMWEYAKLFVSHFSEKKKFQI